MDDKDLDRFNRMWESNGGKLISDRATVVIVIVMWAIILLCGC